MNYFIDKSFQRDAKKASKPILKQLPEVLASILQADSILEIPNIKKMKGYKDFYRIRIGDYRLGLYTENHHVILSRLLPRKDIYKRFP